MTYAMRTSPVLRPAEHHPRGRVPVGRPFERADQEPRGTAQPEAAEPVEPPLPRELSHHALEVAHRETGALELGDELVAQPELVVDRIAVASLAVRARHEAVLCVEDQVAAGPEDAAQLGVEELPLRRLPAAHEADAEREIEARARERKPEPVAADEAPP